jgi:hypothetical protein
MADNWEPIRLYAYLGSEEVPKSTTREQVAGYLNNTDPDRIEHAGTTFVNAAKLVKGDGGIQGAIMKAARDLADVWQGGGATTALQALRLLHSSAGALGEAMEKTGHPMIEYGKALRATRAGLPASDENTGGGTTGQPSPSATPPASAAENTGGGATGQPSPSAGPPVYTPGNGPDEQARKLLTELNRKLTGFNSRIADGLNFEMPNIAPMEVDTEKAPTIDPGRGTRTPMGTTLYWHGSGDGSGDGSTGTGNGSSTGTGSGTSGGHDGGTSQGGGDQNGSTPGDQTSDDQQQQDNPQDSGQNDPGSPTDQTGQSDQTNQNGQNGQNGQQQDVPPVIGGNDQQTQLASNPAPTMHQTPTTAHQTAPNLLTHTPANVYTPTNNPFATPGGQGTWYGTGGMGAPAAPAVLGGGPGAKGSGFMGYPPGGGGGGGQDGQERDRTIYDPEGDLFSMTTHQVGPDKIG